MMKLVAVRILAKAHKEFTVLIKLTSDSECFSVLSVTCNYGTFLSEFIFRSVCGGNFWITGVYFNVIDLLLICCSEPVR